MDVLIRLVTFRPLEGQERELGALISTQAVAINHRFGALRVWCLSGEPGMAIVSAWASAEDLDRMRAHPEYVTLLNGIKAMSQDLADRRYWLIAGSPIGAEHDSKR
jgi:hypothetical protein